MGKTRYRYLQHTLDDFSGGINVDSSKPRQNEVRNAKNFNLTKRGLLELRGGSQKLNATAIPVTSGVGITSLHELWTRNLTSGAKTRYLLATAKTNLILLNTPRNTLIISSVTNLSTSLSNDLKPDIADFQNKAYYVNGTDAVWTDGTQVKNIGIEQPASAPTLVSVSSTGGYMSDGTYILYYAYARSSNYGFYGEVGGSLTVTLTGGTNTQKITVNVVASNTTGTSADKIYLFSTKDGDAASWYKVGEVSNPNDGSTVSMIRTINDNSIADSAIYESDHTPPVSGVKFIRTGGSRMIYADDTYVYFSKPNLPECVPADNIIKPAEDDGQQITGLGIILNQLIIYKQRKRMIVDVTALGSIDPVPISNLSGCSSFRTITPVLDGQLTINFSQDGFIVTDGVKVKNISEDKILTDLKSVDYSNIDKATGVYYATNRQYLCYLPYTGGVNKIWVFSADGGGFTLHDYGYKIDAYGIFTNESSKERLVQAMSSGTDGYIVETDLSTYNDDGIKIPFEIKIPFSSLGRPDIEKNFRMLHLYYKASTKMDFDVTIGLNGVEKMDRVTMSCSGSAGFDSSPVGFDNSSYGFDMSGEETDYVYFGRVSGNTFNHSIVGEVDGSITFKEITTSFHTSRKRGYND